MKKFYNKLEYATILLAAVGIIIFVFNSIVLRYVFNIVLSWPDELSRYLQIYIVWMGASASFTKRNVLKIDFLQLIFPNMNWPNIVADVITLIGSLILFVSIFKFTTNKYDIMETSMIMGIPLWIVGMIISLSVLALIVKVGIRIIGFFVSNEVSKAS